MNLVKTIIEESGRDEGDYLRCLKQLSVENLRDKKLQFLNRIEVIDFLIMNGHVVELENALGFIIDNQSSFIAATDVGPLSPTVDSVFTFSDSVFNSSDAI